MGLGLIGFRFMGSGFRAFIRFRAFVFGFRVYRV